MSDIYAENHQKDPAPENSRGQSLYEILQKHLQQFDANFAIAWDDMPPTVQTTFNKAEKEIFRYIAKTICGIGTRSKTH